MTLYDPARAAQSIGILAPNDSISLRQPAIAGPYSETSQPQPEYQPALQHSAAQTEIDAAWRADLEKRYPTPPAIDAQEADIASRKRTIEQERLMPVGSKSTAAVNEMGTGGRDWSIEREMGGQTIGEKQGIEAADQAAVRAAQTNPAVINAEAQRANLVTAIKAYEQARTPEEKAAAKAAMIAAYPGNPRDLVDALDAAERAQAKPAPAAQ